MRATPRAGLRWPPLCVSLLLFAGALADAQENTAYAYSYWRDTLAAPPAYAATETFDGGALGTGELENPEDIFVGPDGELYIADTGNDRIIRVSSDWKETRIYDSFLDNGARDAFDGPAGVFATAYGVYVADTRHQRIVLMEEDGGRARIIERPRSDLLRAEYAYLPARLVADRARRLYVIGPGMYEGIMEFDQEGRFAGFLGSNRVTFNPMDYFWKRISTREQKKGMASFVPEEFSGIDIDDRGFLYSTTREEDARHPVKKHNAEGTDVLRRAGFFPPSGDVRVNNTGTIKGPSTFVDVAVEGSGIYHCLDAKRGRVFSYDKEGNLLSIFGGLGDTRGRFRDPVALAVRGDALLVLDRALGRVTVFEPTEYGRILGEAVVRYDAGDYDTAFVLWTRALALNSNLELGYTGLGKIQLRRRELTSAMDSFLLANDRPNYSKAFRRFREGELRAAAPYALSACAFLGLALLAYRRLRPRRAGTRLAHADGRTLPLSRRILFALHLMRRPFDGFWDLKYEGIGTVSSAAVMMGACFLILVARSLLTGFLFNTVNVARYNPASDALKSLVPVLLFCIGNWSLTSLMDGEGSMRDIFISTAYAASPLIILLPAAIILSNSLALEEAAFLRLVEWIAYGWCGLLVFVGNKTVHGYTVRKTIGMLLLTVVAIGVILFLLLLFVTFVEQVWSFLSSLYREILYRV